MMQQHIDNRTDEMFAVADDNPLQIEAVMRMPLFSYFDLLSRKREQAEKHRIENARIKAKSNRRK